MALEKLSFTPSNFFTKIIFDSSQAKSPNVALVAKIAFCALTLGFGYLGCYLYKKLSLKTPENLTPEDKKTLEVFKDIKGEKKDSSSKPVTKTPVDEKSPPSESTIKTTDVKRDQQSDPVEEIPVDEQAPSSNSEKEILVDKEDLPNESTIKTTDVLEDLRSDPLEIIVVEEGKIHKNISFTTDDPINKFNFTKDILENLPEGQYYVVPLATSRLDENYDTIRFDEFLKNASRPFILMTRQVRNLKAIQLPLPENHTFNGQKIPMLFLLNHKEHPIAREFHKTNMDLLSKFKRFIENH